ncbi:hypothetical protein [Phenylobacterium sp.]|uniref:hypothetical protein n=1 Tax=Phenylobacterium sp. TaxID=1871053 RepID=UPI0025D1909E|nr:hypothetical protein [Phenylobacterium sp.]
MLVEFKSRDVRGAPGDILATVIERTDGEPMRRITNGRRHRPVGHYYSQKNGFSVPWESRNELHGFYHAEVDANVVAYRAQPHTLRMGLHGVVSSYTPDRADRLSDGRTEIIEIKDAFKPERDPAYERKLHQASAIYRHLGWRFRIVERTDLEAAPRFKTIEEVQSYRRTAVTAQDVFVVSRLFHDSPERTLGEVIALFGNPVLGMAKAYAMTVRRILALDLTVPLNDAMPVRLLRAEGAAHA